MIKFVKILKNSILDKISLQMPADIYWYGDFVEVNYHGAITVNDIKLVMSDIVANKNFNSLKYQLNNFLKIDMHKSSVFNEKEADTLGALDKEISKWKNEIYIANVRHDLLEKYDAYYLQNIIDTPWTVRFFSNTNDAFNWLYSKGLT